MRICSLYSTFLSALQGKHNIHTCTTLLLLCSIVHCHSTLTLQNNSDYWHHDQSPPLLVSYLCSSSCKCWVLQLEVYEKQFMFSSSQTLQKACLTVTHKQLICFILYSIKHIYIHLCMFLYIIIILYFSIIAAIWQSQFVEVHSPVAPVVEGAIWRKGRTTSAINGRC